MEGLVSSTEGGRLPTFPCARFIQPGGDGSVPSPVFGFIWGAAALYRPLCSASYRRRGAALYRPLFPALHDRGETAAQRPLCSVLYITVGRQLSTVPCVRFYIVIVQA